jgi:hypothetical protein
LFYELDGPSMEMNSMSIYYIRLHLSPKFCAKFGGVHSKSLNFNNQVQFFLQPVASQPEVIQQTL